MYITVQEGGHAKQRHGRWENLPMIGGFKHVTSTTKGQDIKHLTTFETETLAYFVKLMVHN